MSSLSSSSSSPINFTCLSPMDPGVAVTVADDCKATVWRSREFQAKMAEKE